MDNITAIVEINGKVISVLVPPVIEVALSVNNTPYTQQPSDWNSVVTPTVILNKPQLERQGVKIKSSNYTMEALDQTIVFTTSSNLIMLPATGTGHTVRIISRNCSVILVANDLDTIRVSSISGYSDVTLTDSQPGVWE